MNQIQQFFEYFFNAIKIWIIVQPWQTGIRVRVGKKVKILTKGIYFRIPYFDSVYIQENRLRVLSMPVQTLTSKDSKTITLTGALGYSISNIEKLYETLYQPETTISNMVMSEVSEYVVKNRLDNIKPEELSTLIIKKMNTNDFGLEFKYFRILNFAVVRTFRLIQDKNWTYEGLKMNDKK